MIIKCRECGREISDRAIACPRCGWPGRRKPTLTPAGIFIIVVILGILAAIVLPVFTG